MILRPKELIPDLPNYTHSACTIATSSQSRIRIAASPASHLRTPELSQPQIHAIVSLESQTMHSCHAATPKPALETLDPSFADPPICLVRFVPLSRISNRPPRLPPLPEQHFRSRAWQHHPLADNSPRQRSPSLHPWQRVLCPNEHTIAGL